MEPQQILDDYNYYRSFTTHVRSLRAQGQPIADVKMRTKKGEDRTPYFEGMLSFCDEHKLDPKVWLYLLFKIRKWQAAPRFHQLVPKSKKTLQKNLGLYADLRDLPLFRQNREAQRVTAEAETGEGWDVNRDIGFSTEALKRRYLNEGDAERCLSEMEIRTYGYHPRSLVCARCPIAQRCAQQVEVKYGTHMLSLRRGEITSRQAQQLAFFQRQHGG